MKIEYWGVEESIKLTQAYNDQIVGVPHCYAVSQKEFKEGIIYHKVNGGEYSEDIHSEKLIVCEENGIILSFSDVAIAETEFEGKKEQKGFIRFLTYKSGNRSVGQTLLMESEKYLFSFGVNQIKAFRLLFIRDHCGYRFYHLNYGMLSDKLGHIHGLLGMNGYKISGGEIFMDQPAYQVDEPVLYDKSLDITVEFQNGRAVLPKLNVKAFRDGKEIGQCKSESAGECCDAKEAQDWVFVTGLGINENDQKKGLGRYLLQRNLWEMSKIGYKNSVISTDWNNFRALLFYTNYGYKVVDTMHEFVKIIE
ncbi:MAG: family N-acetyltransferase [Candidatus Poribacteria bacterium]|nr:family N-acetyltransferase [Candidatus Poribacteria bacterium]